MNLFSNEAPEMTQEELSEEVYFLTGFPYTMLSLRPGSSGEQANW